MRILGIETSCDETAAAVIEMTRGQFSALSNVVASQVKIHAKTGGVVPEVAARAHIEKLIPVVERALRESKSTITKYSAAAHNSVMRRGKEIDAIAVTAGPGLVTSLLVGVEVARTLSWLWKKPVLAVNHLAGHVYANFLGEKIGSKEQRAKSKEFDSKPYALSSMQFPALALIVSGGHTELVLMRRHLDFQVIGSTRDDAAGEAFDKVAKMLGLPYPGGPAISQLAAKWKSEIRNPKSETNSKFKTPKPDYPTFPRPMIDSPDFDFSFSGLKTAVLYWLRAKSKERGEKPYALSPTLLAQVCYEFQEAVVDVLVAKTVRAAKKYRVKTVLLGGGVAANKRLRQRLLNTVHRELSSVNCILPQTEYTTDNAAMIAAAGYFMAKQMQFAPWKKLEVDPNWELGKKFKPLR